jgi:hypothetical protein
MDTQQEPLVGLAEGVWFREAPVTFLGLHLKTTMAVLRLGDGRLLVYSPVTLTPELRVAIEALGAVAHLYSPDLEHHRWLGEWAAAFPKARVHAPPGLRKKRPDLRIDRVHGERPEPAFEGTVDEIPIAGFRLQETALFYRPAGVLVVADLVHNVGRPTHAWTRTYTRLMGFYDRVGLSRVIRLTAFSDRKAARRSIDELLARPFDRLIVGHGAPLPSGGHQAVESTYGWLRP